MIITKIMLDELSVPLHIAQELVAKYMEYITEPREFVIQRHEIGDSQHFDLRLWVGNPYGKYAIGWSVHPDEKVLVKSEKGIEVLSLEELFKRFKSIERKDGYEIVRPISYQAIAFRGGIGYWVPITAIIRHKYKGKMLKLDQKWGIIRVTPNHSIYSQDCVPVLASSNPEMLAIRNMSYSSSKKTLVINTYPREDKKSILYERELVSIPSKLEDEQLRSFLYFLGAFISEGYLYKTKEDSYLIHITNNDLSFLRRVQASILKALNLKSWIIGPSKKGTYILELSNKALYYYLKNNVGERAFNKIIPPKIMTLKKELLKVLWNGLFEGYKKWKSYSTLSEKLAIQVCFLLVLFGHNFTVKKCLDKKNKSWVYNIFLSDHYQLNKAEKKIESFDYEGYVYDLELAPIHNFTCGFGLIVCHNSIVGFSKDDPATIEKLLENIGKGFRAETKCVSDYCNEWKFILYEKNGKYYVKEKNTEALTIEELARQPYDWFFPRVKVGETIEIEPGEVGAGIEAPGRFTILARGKWLSGCNKPYFHEYFLKDEKYFKDWTRIVLRAIKIQKIDPKSKRPIPGKYERLWRFMIPKNQMPYTISNRSIKEKWKPPKECPFPFPREWVKEKFPEQYRKWLQWITKSEEEDIEKLEKLYESKKEELLSKNIRFTLGLASWMGARAITGRRMPKMRWLLFLDDKGTGKVRTFLLDGYPLKETIMGAYEFPRSSRKWLDYEGETDPDTPPVNPNKELIGQYSIIDTGTVKYTTTKTENGEELIELVFKGKRLKGKYQLVQEEKGTDVYTFEKLTLKESLVEGAFVLDKHWYPESSKEYHLDLRIKLPDRENIIEFNIWKAKEIKDLEKLEVGYPARLKICRDLEWMKIKKPGTRMKAYGKWTKVETIEHGDIELIEENPRFMSFKIKGTKLEGYYIARKIDGLWELMKSKLPKALTLAETLYSLLGKEGDPRAGVPFDPFIIEQKRGWSYFKVYIYDLRKFTRVEPKERVKEYLPDIEVPESVDIAIGLYPRIGKIHGARVAYVKFDTDKWTYKEAISFIKKNKLDKWSGTQIRKKKK